ncbi:hypothetical protein ACSRNT_005025, partial [Escherichia coli]
VWDRLPTADPGGPATISSQAYAYYMQNVPFCIFVPTAHDDLSLYHLLRKWFKVNNKNTNHFNKI